MPACPRLSSISSLRPVSSALPESEIPLNSESSWTQKAWRSATGASDGLHEGRNTHSESENAVQMSPLRRGRKFLDASSGGTPRLGMSTASVQGMWLESRLLSIPLASFMKSGASLTPGATASAWW